MTYNPSIPQPADLISQSQSAILTNFTQLNTIFSNNHYEYNFATAADRGKHRFCTFPEQAVDPATAANEAAIYTKVAAGASELYLRRESNGTVIQLSVGDPTVAASGSTFLPGGLILKWGTFQILFNNTTAAVVFSGAFPNNVFSVTTGDAGSTANHRYSISALNTAGFTATRYTTALTVTYYYIAIGN